MQFDLLRAFPYPVLRPHVDDYIEGDIQATIEFEHLPKAEQVRAQVTFAVSVPEIEHLIKEGHAKYMVVFVCRDTYFREAVSSDAAEFERVFASGELRGEVILHPYVVVTKAIAAYTCPWINTEFGVGPFKFSEGELLAVDEPQAIYLDRESFKPVSSAFVLVANQNLTDTEWRVDSSGDKVLIQVSPSLKERIDAARSGARNKAVLLNSIYFGAVMQCLSHLRQEPSVYSERQWAQIFRQKCLDIGIDIAKHDECQIAQVMMKHPFSLVDTYCFKEVLG